MCPVVILGILMISAPSFLCVCLFSLLEQCFSTAYFQLIILTKLGGLQAHLVFHFYRDFNVTHFLSNALHFIIIIIIIIITLFRLSIICLFIYSFTYYWFKLGVSAAHINLKSYLDAPKAHLIVDIYIFRATGNVTFGNETTEVQNGTMKFFVQVDSLTPHQTPPMICFRKCCRKEGGVSVGAGGGGSAIY